MHAPKGTIVLFQYLNHIIASATLLDIEKYPKPIDNYYWGHYLFDCQSIAIFEPISANDIIEIIPDFKKFSRAIQHIDYDYLEKINSLILKKKVQLVSFPDEIIGKFPESGKKQVTVNRYERNPKARKVCIEHYKPKCQVCGFDFGKFYGAEFNGKIHVHHIKPLSEIDNKYEIDPINDLVPVCPNCHLILHSNANGTTYTIEELRHKIEKIMSKKRRRLDGQIS